MLKNLSLTVIVAAPLGLAVVWWLTRPAMVSAAALPEGFGHCAECHSPRDALGGIVARQRLAGGPNPEGEGWVPNITRKGLADWSEDDIGCFLESGQAPDGNRAGGSIARVIRKTAQLGAEDRAAMAPI